ncbi:MAG: hypothetical protein WCK27_27430 [Verrucomicrobiota bacterium]
MFKQAFFPLALIGSLAATLSAVPLDLSHARIVVLNPGAKVEARAAAMLRDEVDKRTRIGLEIVAKLPDGKEPVILIGTAEELARESFQPPTGCKLPAVADACAVWVDATRRAGPTICVAGYDLRGTVFAVGRLLRLAEMGRDKLQLDAQTKVATAPKFPLRGHQLGYRPKTNAYDAWTLAMWEQYYRDMMVFGMNAIELIPPRSDDAPDSPHFPKPPMEMMVGMSQVADDYGLDVWIWYPCLDKDYSDAQTVQFALNEQEEVFKKLPRIDAIFIPGGDPGETRPDLLLALLEKTKKVLNRYHPRAQIWVSPQGFDRFGKPHRRGWLKMFLDLVRTNQPDWLDGVVFGPQVEMSLANLRKELPSRYPIRQYPDITHSRACQYAVPGWDRAFSSTEGRETINPRPQGHAKIFRSQQAYSNRFITYSEGCNDDFNKVLWSCLGWDPDMKVEDITREYSRYFISGRYEDQFSRGLLALEQDWVGPLLANQGVTQTVQLFQQMEQHATPQERLNWRFQEGLYRAYYDGYIRERLIYETGLEKQAREILRTAPQIGVPAALEQVDKILGRATKEPVGADLRARVFELGEALFQSIRMQLSVPRYQAIAVERGANLDEIDMPLAHLADMKKRMQKIRQMGSDAEKLAAVADMAAQAP